jgi:hypothetical protein
VSAPSTSDGVLAQVASRPARVTVDPNREQRVPNTRAGCTVKVYSCARSACTLAACTRWPSSTWAGIQRGSTGSSAVIADAGPPPDSIRYRYRALYQQPLFSPYARLVPTPNTSSRPRFNSRFTRD